MLYLCDNQALQKAVKRRAVEGGKATLVGAPEAKKIFEAIEEHRKRTTAGAATFLVKINAHRGETASEEADIQADKAISGHRSFIVAISQFLQTYASTSRTRSTAQYALDVTRHARPRLRPDARLQRQ